MNIPLFYTFTGGRIKFYMRTPEYEDISYDTNTYLVLPSMNRQPLLVTPKKTTVWLEFHKINKPFQPRLFASRQIWKIISDKNLEGFNVMVLDRILVCFVLQTRSDANSGLFREH